ncbi:MAG: SpoIIE family protein phosphatase [Treponema sp.]|nr:SpoIIE family protein phosphatase [Treponema sp.]
MGIVFDPGMALSGAVVVFAVAGLFAVVRGVGGVLAESAEVRAAVSAILTGDFMPLEKKERLSGMNKRGIGLRFKIAAFTMVLSLLVVVMVSVPLYYIMTQTQRETLLYGLWNRSAVLLEGLASSARQYLSSGDTEGLGPLPARSVIIPEARYVTITGYPAGGNGAAYGDYVWATNDPDILSKIDTERLLPGVSRLSDTLSPRLGQISREMNGEARIGSEPAFSTGNVSPRGNHRYIFYKPLVYRQGENDMVFGGVIRLEVSTESIIEIITAEQVRLFSIILIVALAALAIGVIGALVLSSLIIRPIRKLVSHVEIIRDTEDKADLAGLDIRFTTWDEIAVLGNTINDMTRSLAQAALTASDLSIGKELQKKFIPLELDREGNKLSFGYKDTPNAHFFGYYEGAKGVSGDYFNYLDLDGRYFAIIKCDVAGKGVSAALIMIQVATMFLNHFKQWKPTAQGMRLEEFVYQINDFFESMRFEGRFAALTLCLFDCESGLLRICHAGDNLVHLYDASAHHLKTIALPETPAVGAIANATVKSRVGYAVQTLTLDHGDILLLYTDGIEEAKRKFRDSHFREIICDAGPNSAVHGNHVVGQGSEELGPDRVKRIIEALMNRGVYTLHKWHNGEGDKPLHFNFAGCEGKVEEVIMALVSVEKMFRCYKDSRPGSGDTRVLVDKKIDAFLKSHFLEYRNYCADTCPYAGNDTYMYYTRIEEDEQYDDLTILGIKRK